MSALRKAGVWLGLVEDEGDAAYDEGEPAPRDPRRPGGRPREARRRYDDEYADPEDEPLAERRGDGSRPTERVPVAGAGSRRRPEPGGEATIRPIAREARDARDVRDTNVSYLTRDNLARVPEMPPPQPAPSAADGDRRYQITTLHPTTYREARTIGEHFREGTPVIMNLTEMEEADARRLVDFGAGLAFGLRGSMERVTNRVFLLSPANVHVTAEDKAKIAEGEFFHHHR